MKNEFSERNKAMEFKNTTGMSPVTVIFYVSGDNRDKYLSFVLCKIPGDGNLTPKYVTWTYNSSCPGFSSGSYYNNLGAALEGYRNYIRDIHCDIYRWSDVQFYGKEI